MIHFTGQQAHGHKILPFSINEPVDSLSISASTQGQLYAYLYDSTNELRANLMLEKRITNVGITKNHASLGGLAGHIHQGEWQLHIYNLDNEGKLEKPIDYDIAIEFNKAVVNLDVNTQTSLRPNGTIDFDYNATLSTDSGWFKGDLHAHTIMSDGNNTLESAVKVIDSQNLDFIFLTDHNICHPELPVSNNTLIIPSLEVTTGKGHFNVHGPRQMLDMKSAAYDAASLIEQGLTLSNDENTNFSINHPTMKPWHWTYDDVELAKIGTLEICCDPTWPTSPVATEGAIKIHNAMWNAGVKIAAVGGSDSHLEPHERYANATVPSIYGDPATYVYADNLSADGIITGLKKGHTYFERQCGLVFEINKGRVLPGQDVKDETITYKMRILDTENTYFAQIVVDGLILEEIPLSAMAKSHTIEMKNHAWVRIDIRRGKPNDEVSRQGNFEGMINCIYNSHHAIFNQSSPQTWVELMATMAE